MCQKEKGDAPTEFPMEKTPDAEAHAAAKPQEPHDVPPAFGLESFARGGDGARRAFFFGWKKGATKNNSFFLVGWTKNPLKGL